MAHVPGVVSDLQVIDQPRVYGPRGVYVPRARSEGARRLAPLVHDPVAVVVQVIGRGHDG